MIKCIYRNAERAPEPHCDKEADYIYLGKSYCAEHLEVRSEEVLARRIEDDKRLEDLRNGIKD